MNWQTLSNSFQKNVENCIKYFLTCLKQELRKNKYYDESNIKILAKKLEKNNYIKNVNFHLWDTEEEAEYVVTPISISVTFNMLADGFETTVDVSLGMYGISGSIISDGFEDSYVDIKSSYFKI